MQYNAEIELAGSIKNISTDVMDAILEDLVDALRDYSPAAGRGPSDMLQVIVTVEAQSLEHATGLVWTLIHSVWPGMVFSLSLMPTTEFDRRIEAAN